MKILLLFLFSVMLLGSTAAAQTGALKGSVSTATGRPAANVNLRIKGTTKTTVSDEKGHFAFEKIPTGQHLIILSAVGMAIEEKNVRVVAGQTEIIHFVIHPTARQLEEITVKGALNVFAADQPSMAVKIPLKPLESPQVYQVISKALMKEQVITHYQEALNNIPGAMTTTVNGGNGATYVKMRGFYSTGGFRDGLPVIQYAPEDPVNIEKIEAIKGPAGALFGSVASYGGLINRITKLPYDSLGGSVAYYVGSDDLNRLTIDLNVPLNREKTALFRLNGALHRESSFQDYGYKRNDAIDPTFLFKVSDQLQLTFSTAIYRSHWITAYYNYSFPTQLTDIKDLPIGYEQSLTGDDFQSTSNTLNNYVKATYQLSSHWRSITTFTRMQNRWQPMYSFGLDWLGANNYQRTVGKTAHTTFTTFDLQQKVQGDVHIGGMRNRIVLGLDYYHYTSRFANYNEVIYDTLHLPAEGIAPLSMARFTTLLGPEPLQTSRSSQQTWAVYAADVINFTGRFMGMLSLRADHFHNGPTVTKGVETDDNVYNQQAWSPKFGLVYQALKDRLSLFASYANGFVNKGPVTQPDGSVSVFEPEHANQWEGGIKANLWAHRLNGTLSYFNILVDHKIRRSDETGFQVQDGSQRHAGIELDLQANPLEGLNVVAGYAYLDARYLKVARDLQGKRPTTTPRHIGNFWIDYHFGNGIGLALGGNYIGATFANSQNTLVLPAYLLINASVFCAFDAFTLRIKGNNLGNVKHWDMNYYPQPLRQFTGSIAYHF